MRMEYLKNVVTLRLDVETCIGCGRCVEVCPHAVFDIQARKSRIVARDACMECGACARNCSRRALTVRSGAGCLEAILRGALTGTEPHCDCC